MGDESDYDICLYCEDMRRKAKPVDVDDETF